jgi:hypothetical protein
MTVLKVKIQKDFTVLYNGVLENPRLSFRAKGLWAYCMSKSEDWEFHVSHLASVSSEGRDAIYTAIRELESEGLIEKARKREKGKFGPIDYIVYPYPQELKKVLHKLKKKQPRPGKPYTVNPQLPSTDSLPSTDKTCSPLPPKGGGTVFSAALAGTKNAPEEEASIELKLFCSKIPECDQPSVLRLYYADKEKIDKRAKNLVGYLVKLWEKGVHLKFERKGLNKEKSLTIYESVKKNLNGVSFRDKGNYLELSGGDGGVCKAYYSDETFESDLMHFLSKKGITSDDDYS